MNENSASGTDVPQTSTDRGQPMHGTAWALRLGLAAIILAAGIAASLALSKLRKRPKSKPVEETVHSVTAVRVESQPVTLVFSGYGVARPARTVDVSAEVRGRIVNVREPLKAGELLEADEVILQIQSIDFELALARAKAEQARLAAELRRLQQQQKDEERRLTIVRRERDLAQKAFERASRLFKEKRVGSEAEVDRSDQELQAREAALIAQESALATYPLRLDALAAEQERATAVVRQATADLERCTVKCPFAARIVEARAEAGAFVNAGQALVVLADDQYLEVPVTIEGIDLTRGLKWLPAAENGYRHWFSGFSENKATVSWVEAPEQVKWAGRVTRLERFDSETRSAMLVVRLDAPAAGADAGVPVVAGMFCKAELSGRRLEAALVIPRTALQSENKIFIVNAENRLEERDVVVSHTMGNRAVLASGVESGEFVVASHVPDSFTGLKVNVVEETENPDSP